MKRIDAEGLVVPSDDHKLYQKGVTTPVVQTVIFAAGGWIVFITLAFGVWAMPAWDGLRWSVVTFGLVLGAGLMLRMAGPSLRIAIAGWAANRRDAQIETLEGQVAYLQAQLKQAGVKSIPTGEMRVIQCARAMIDAQFAREAYDQGGGWARDPFLKATGGTFTNADWEAAREILEGAGIRAANGKRRDLLVKDVAIAKQKLVDFATRAQGHYTVTQTGDFVRTA